MSLEHTPDVVPLRVALSNSPEGHSNRVIVYDWFVRGVDRAPPRGGNRIELLVDGEAGWGRVAEDIEAATEEIDIATWMCRPETELCRPKDLAVAEPSERGRFRLGELLERRASAGAKVRLLIWGMLYTPILDRWMRRWYWRGRDNIDVLEQDHPSWIGSHHQKTITIDGRIGYCGGMNLKENDWDSIAHLAHEPRRFPHAAPAERRRKTAERVEPPPFPPRHDLIMRIEGPAVADLAANFASRWRQSVRARKRSIFGRLFDWLRRMLGNNDYPELTAPKALPPAQGEHWCQIVRTMPGGEDGILDAYVRAIRNARRYIYIENQYFRSPIIGRELRDALRRNPRLRLAAVVWPINDGKKSFLDPSGYWTARTQELIREARPEFMLTHAMTWGHDANDRVVYQTIDVHAKVMIVDDVWVTIGSANINDRGFKTEGEINGVVLDKGLAGDLRRRLMAEHLEIEPGDERLDDIDAIFDLWDEHGQKNPQRRVEGQPPLSRVHYFVQEGLSRPPFGVGSGVF